MHHTFQPYTDWDPNFNILNVWFFTFFFKTRTHEQISNWPIFHLYIFFKTLTLTHRSAFLNLVNFSFQNFHQFFFKTPTHAQICLNFNPYFFLFITRTHAQICLNFHPYFFSFHNKHTRTDMSEFSSVFFFKARTHAQIWILQTGCTEIVVMKVADFSSVFVFKTRTHAQIWSLQTGWFVSSQNVRLFILAFFSESTHTRTNINVIKVADFSRALISFKNTHTRTDMHFTKWLTFFHLKMSEYLFLLFSENTHTRTDIDVIKVADFSSAFSFQYTHTRTYMNFTKWLICFISKCLNLYSCFFFFFFWKDAYTHRYRCYKDGRFSIHISFSKHAHTHRYAFYKVAYFFHLKMS